MPSRRMIDPAFWHSETVAALSVARRYFFIGLFSNADDQGRLKAHPALLRSQLYPYDDIPLEEIQAALTELAEGGFITLYSAQGKEYLQIPNWWSYQRPKWARPSEHPPPEGWTDRIRYRQGNTVIKDNWNGPDEDPGSSPDPGSNPNPVPTPGQDEQEELPEPEQNETTVESPRNGDEPAVGPAPSSRGRDRDRGRDSDRGSESGSNRGSDGARPPPRTTSAAGPKRNIHAVRASLTALGVNEPTLTELVQASWVSEELIDAWWRYISTWRNADSHVRIASLIERLRARRVPPPEYRRG